MTLLLSRVWETPSSLSWAFRLQSENYLFIYVSGVTQATNPQLWESLLPSYLNFKHRQLEEVIESYIFRCLQGSSPPRVSVSSPLAGGHPGCADILPVMGASYLNLHKALQALAPTLCPFLLHCSYTWWVLVLVCALAYAIHYAVLGPMLLST